MRVDKARVRAFGQKLAHDIRLPVFRGLHQRRAGVFHVARVGVRACCQKFFDERGVVERVEQDGRAAFVDGVGIDGVCQDFIHRSLALRREKRGRQRGMARVLRLDVGVAAVAQHEAHNRGAGLRVGNLGRGGGKVKRRAAAAVAVEVCAFLEQCFDERKVALLYRVFQRRHAHVVLGVHVAAEFQHLVDRPCHAALDGDLEGGALARVGLGEMGIDAVNDIGELQQGDRRFFLPCGQREKKRRRAVGRHLVGVGSRLDHSFDHAGLALFDRAVEQRAAIDRVAGNVAAVARQQGDQFGLAEIHGVVDGQLFGLVLLALARVRAVVEQKLRHFRQALLGGDVQRRVARVVVGVEVDFLVDVAFDFRQLVALHGEIKRGVAGGRLDVARLYFLEGFLDLSGQFAEGLFDVVQAVFDIVADRHALSLARERQANFGAAFRVQFAVFMFS